jgi:hypothetical protein
MSNKMVALGTFDSWSKPDLTSLTAPEKERYEQKYSAMRLYCSGASTQEIVNATGLKRQSVDYYAKRCMQAAPDGSWWGCRALLPNILINGYHRTKPAKPKLTECQGGQSGVLTQTFEKYPGLEDDFIKLVVASEKTKNVSEYKERSVTYHHAFLHLLKARGATNNEWPFYTKHLGRRSVSEYVKQVKLDNLHRVIMNEGERAAKAHLSVGRALRPTLVFTEPFDAVEIDAYKWDCHSSVQFKTPDGLYTNVRISRLWVLMMVDCASKAILSYKCVFRSEVAATDVIDVMRNSIQGQPRPEPAIEGLIYPDGSGIPSAVLEHCKDIVFSTVKFDGALAHLSEKVTNTARKELGYFWTLGSPGHFERRPHIECVNGLLSTNVFCRLPSTTGHNPNNGRADRCEQVATQVPILADHLMHLLDVEIAQYNARISEGLFWLSPLEFIQQKMAKDHQHFLARRLPQSSDEEGGVLQMKKIVIVRGSVKQGRHPYIQFLRVRYSSVILSDAWGLIGEKILIRIDENDLRVITAYTLKGCLLCKLIAIGKWADTRHDLRTRQAINSKMSDGTLQVALGQDPVQVYLAFLSTRAKGGAVIHAGTATEAKRVADEAGMLLTATEPPLTFNVVEEGRPLEFSDSLIIGKENPDLNEILNQKRRRS